MPRTTPDTEQLLAELCGAGPFAEYCARRGIPALGADPGPDRLARWQAAVARLDPSRQADVELELEQVASLAHRDAIYHLFEASSGRGRPPDLVPGEAAQALWFLVHEPATFLEVYFAEEVREAGSWHGASAPPGLVVDAHEARRDAFGRELRRLFRAREGAGRFCAVRSFAARDPDRVVFVGHVSDRLRLVESFTDDGEHRRQRHRPATRVICVYYPADGTVLLKSRHRARQGVLALLRAFARAVLHAEVDERNLDARYDLERLRTRFDPPLPEGIAEVRVRALELAYPPAEGRRRVRLEVNRRDDRFAILELLARHAGGDEPPGRLRVIRAELQVVLLRRGRAKSHLIRLWPDRCSLGQTETAERLRGCLRSWGLLHAPRP